MFGPLPIHAHTDYTHKPTKTSDRGGELSTWRLLFHQSCGAADATDICRKIWVKLLPVCLT
jgi:hypothetical protein